jgi:hypothetical protein
MNNDKFFRCFRKFQCSLQSWLKSSVLHKSEHTSTVLLYSSYIRTSASVLSSFGCCSCHDYSLE